MECLEKMHTRKPSYSQPETQIPSMEGTFVGHGLLVKEKFPETTIKEDELTSEKQKEIRSIVNGFNEAF